MDSGRRAKNFTNEEIREGIAFAHERGVKVYITANIFAHNDIFGSGGIFKELGEIGGRSDHSGFRRVYDCKADPAGDGDPYQYPGQ